MKHITLQELERWQHEGKPLRLIDVRTAEERRLFNIGGEWIPLDELVRTQGEWNDPERPVVVYCKRGVRSQIAIQRLQPRFPNVIFYNLMGGIGE